MKVLKCADAGLNCGHVMRAETVDELMKIAGEHAVKDHQLEVTPDLVTKIKSIIKDE